MKLARLVVVLLALTGVIGCKSKDPQTSTSSSAAATVPPNPPPTPPPAPPRAADEIPAPADVAAPPSDAARTESGLASRVLSPGTGTEHPTAQDVVRVNYTGWTTDGHMFDSSARAGQPAEFPLGQVIQGWTEGVQLMVVGEKRRFWIPQSLAYQGRPGAPAGMLVFDVELLEIKKMPAPPATPPDVATPPRNAQCTPVGLCARVLSRGTGRVHPSATSVVTVHYTGWTTDGRMFDSSVTRGQPARFPLDHVIPGWTLGVQQMVVGEKRRLWIPESLAYQGAAGAPSGMLVFDVELLSIDAP